MRTMLVEAPHGKPAGDEQQRCVRGELPWTDPIRYRHVGERIAHDRVYARPLADQLVEAGKEGASSGEYDLVDLVVGSRGEEELQRPRDLEGERFHERLQDI